MNSSRLLAWPLDVQKLKQQSNLQLMSTEKIIKVDESTTKMAGNGSAGNRTSSTQLEKGVRNIDVFCFGFYFMSPKWNKTTIVIEITLLLQAYSCLPLVHPGYRNWRISPEVLIQIGLVLIAHGNENPFQLVLFCSFVI